MAQLAIYKGILAHVTDDTGDGVILDGEIEVKYGDMGIILDPTDAQVRAAESGDEIPMDPDEAGEMETLMRDFGLPEPTIKGAMDHWRIERPIAMQRRRT